MTDTQLLTAWVIIGTAVLVAAPIGVVAVRIRTGVWYHEALKVAVLVALGLPFVVTFGLLLGPPIAVAVASQWAWHRFTSWFDDRHPVGGAS